MARSIPGEVVPVWRWPRVTIAGCLALAGVVAACSGGGSDGTTSNSAEVPWPSATAAPTASAPVDAPPPALDECEAFWIPYHRDSPDDPYTDHDGFVARCQSSERPVLQCLEKARDELLAIVRETSGPSAVLDPTFLRMGLPGRIGPCITRERVRFALRTGELPALVRQVESGRLSPGAPPGHALVPSGTFATLAWRRMHEGGDTPFELAPPGELRVSRRADGRVWIYMLGALLGRHQNQTGFLYSSAPFVPGDFQRDGADELIRLGPDAPKSGPAGYWLQSFAVLERMSPQLLFVGSAPD